MGKIRVYELAKELNLGNRELLQKLQGFGYPVRSHSSTLEDFQVREIKERLQGKRAQAISEASGRPTVIRRRKRPVAPESEPVSDAGPDSETGDDEASEGAFDAAAQEKASPTLEPGLSGEEGKPEKLDEKAGEAGQVMEETLSEESKPAAEAEVDKPKEEAKVIKEPFKGTTETPAVIVAPPKTSSASPKDQEPKDDTEVMETAPSKTEMVSSDKPADTAVEVEIEKPAPEEPAASESTDIIEPVQTHSRPDVQEKEAQDAQAMDINEAKEAAVTETAPKAEKDKESKPSEAPPEAPAQQKEQVKPKERMEKSPQSSGPAKKGPIESHPPKEQKFKQKVKKIEKTTAEPAKIISRPKPPVTPPAPPVRHDAPQAHAGRPGPGERSFDGAPSANGPKPPRDHAGDQGPRRRPPTSQAPGRDDHRPTPAGRPPQGRPVSRCRADDGR